MPNIHELRQRYTLTPNKSDVSRASAMPRSHIEYVLFSAKWPRDNHLSAIEAALNAVSPTVGTPAIITWPRDSEGREVES